MSDATRSSAHYYSTRLSPLQRASRPSVLPRTERKRSLVQEQDHGPLQSTHSAPLSRKRQRVTLMPLASGSSNYAQNAVQNFIVRSKLLFFVNNLSLFPESQSFDNLARALSRPRRACNELPDGNPEGTRGGDEDDWTCRDPLDIMRYPDSDGSSTPLSSVGPSLGDDNAGESEEPRERPPVFWYEDGSTIVQCGKTMFKLWNIANGRESNICMLTRTPCEASLHKGLLSASSTFFQKAFESPPVPRPPQSEKQLELQCTMLFIDEDDSDERSFTEIVGFLYHKSDWKRSPPKLDVVGNVLHATTKLSFPYIREHVVAWLEEQWPATLPSPNSSSIPFPEQALLHARTHNIPQIMKRAHYELIRSSDFDAVVEANRGSESHHKLFMAALWLRGRLSEAWVTEMMSPPQEICCTHGTFAAATSPEALSAFWVERVQASGLYLRYTHDPLSGICAMFKRLKLEEAGVCTMC